MKTNGRNENKKRMQPDFDFLPRTSRLIEAVEIKGVEDCDEDTDVLEAAVECVEERWFCW